MPTVPLDSADFDKAANQFDELMRDLRKNSKRRVYEYKTGRVEYDEFYPSLSKDVIDRIDICLADAFQFTDEEIDFLVTYDIKYRMHRRGRRIMTPEQITAAVHRIAQAGAARADPDLRLPRPRQGARRFGSRSAGHRDQSR